MAVPPSSPDRSVRLHRVEPGDWESQRDIRLEMLRAAPDAFWYTYADEADFREADWRERIEGAWLVQARDERGVVGSAGLGTHWEPERAGTATLFGMYVAPRGRGRGIGEALVRAVLEEGHRRGRHHVVLEVASSNTHAIALYERCGFVRTGMTHPHPRDADLCEIEMQVELTG
ncbi:GNAT family N-acetyltransferase [Intrasporangium sp.]|uniref:GNAT family N-acetyltransferase n=1 Tax=Intrasporangium sp. TaxID=1925024 RepID=UPI00322189FE